MPTLAITTNVPGDRLRASEVIKDLSKAVAAGTRKPESVRTDASRSEDYATPPRLTRTSAAYRSMCACR
jgi:hypothetical protein